MSTTTTKKGGAKKKPAKAAEPKEAAKPRKEIDVDKLEAGKAKKRLGAIYKLEKAVERATAALNVASKQRRAAKAKHEEAVEALEREIREQRFGPGPLFSVDGKGAADAPQEQAPKKEAAGS